MNPEDRPVNVRTSVSARDFWSRPRVQGDDPGDVSPDGKVVSQELRSFSVLQDIPRTAPYQLQRPPQRHLPPLRNSRSIERLVYKGALQDAENIDPQPLLEIERLRRENQLLKTQYHAVMRINTLLTQEMSLQAQSYEELLSDRAWVVCVVMTL
jgi:hypothetical protein